MTTTETMTREELEHARSIFRDYIRHGDSRLPWEHFRVLTIQVADTAIAALARAEAAEANQTVIVNECDHVQELERLRASAARADKLAEACKPFARVAAEATDHDGSDLADDDLVSDYEGTRDIVTVGHCRELAAALAAYEEGKGNAENT